MKVFMYFNGELMILSDEGLESSYQLWHLLSDYEVGIQEVLDVSEYLGEL